MPRTETQMAEAHQVHEASSEKPGRSLDEVRKAAELEAGNAQRILV